MSKRDRRLQKRADAAAFLENHSGPVMSMLAQVVEDLAEDNANLTQFEADMALALELGHRLDQAVNFPDPVLEALDNVIPRSSPWLLSASTAPHVGPRSCGGRGWTACATGWRSGGRRWPRSLVVT